jgi:hypothetical protein
MELVPIKSEGSWTSMIAALGPERVEFLICAIVLFSRPKAMN